MVKLVYTVHMYAKCIKFWLRLTCMDDTRYHRKAYNILLNLQRQNNSTCARSSRNVLFKFGFVSENDTPETEVHLLLTCQRYKALRDQLIPSKYCRQPSVFRFFLLLACTNESTMQKLLDFVYKALTTRKQSLSVSVAPYELKLFECSLLLLWAGRLTSKQSCLAFSLSPPPSPRSNPLQT